MYIINSQLDLGLLLESTIDTGCLYLASMIFNEGKPLYASRADALAVVPSGYKVVYYFAEETGVYSHVEIITTSSDVPSQATITPPPTKTSNKVAVYSNSAWELVDDYRGWSGWDASGNEVSITAIGTAPEETWTTTIPNIALYKKALTKLSTQFQTDLTTVKMAYLTAIVNDGSTEDTTKTAVIADIADVKAQYLLDLANLKTQYGVS
jgi:hypothetical protein